MKYKLIAVDLDGTLLTKFKTIKKTDLLAINNYMSDGGICYLSTGRPIVTTLRYMQKINDFCNKKMKYAVAYSGAYIKSFDDNKTFEWLIEDKIAKILYEYALEKKVNVWYYTKEHANHNTVLSNSLSLKRLSKIFKYIDVVKMTGKEKLDSYKINIFHSNKELIEKTYEELTNKHKDILNVCFTNKHLIEITVKNVNKGTALELIAKKEKIEIENTMAIGDSFNDLSAFKASGFAVGIKPSNEDLYKYCDGIIYFKKNAVAEAIKKFVYSSKNINSFIKMLVSDLDGTLLTKDKKIAPETKLILQDVTNKYNIPLTIASGRYIYDILNVLKSLELNPNLDYYVIGNNGAIIFNPKKQEYVSYQPIDASSSQKIYDFIQQVNNDGVRIAAQIYQKEMEILIYNQKFMDEYFNIVYGDKYDDPWQKGPFKSIENYQNKEYVKFVLFFENNILTQKYFKIISKQFPNLEICQSGSSNIEINASGVSKGAALTKLCKHLKFDINQTMVFGDHNNDISMLSLTNYSFCPKDATEKAKKAARHIMNFESSVFIVKAIKEFLLFDMEKVNDK